MSVEFNHTIIHAHNKIESANFVSEILGLPKPEPFSIFLTVKTSNRVNLDFIETDQRIEPQHYAFLVSEDEFDQIFGRIKERGLSYWADPAKKIEGEFNTFGGGRGVYFEDPSKNFLEIITRPYDQKTLEDSRRGH